jgi:hypothetical protein
MLAGVGYGDHPVWDMETSEGQVSEEERELQ